jgi:Fic/DOC family
MTATANSSENERRDSRAFEPELITDPEERAEAEARNGLRQYDLGIQAVQTALDRNATKIRLSLILALHREALAGISVFAGNFRPAGVKIQGSKHEPPGAHLVPGLVEELCDYVNDSWEKSTPIHLAAYVMWRLNCSPVCGRKRTNISHPCIRCSFHPGGIRFTGYADHSGSNRR